MEEVVIEEKIDLHELKLEYSWRKLNLKKITPQNEIFFSSYQSLQSSYSPPPLIDFVLVNHEGYCWMYGGYDANL